MNLHVDSEVGRLRQVILHRPNLELKRLTPSNHDEYLFDDVLWVKHAKQEHDAFAETLRDKGVTVHLLDQLLRETLALPEARKFVLEQTLDERVYGPLAVGAACPLLRRTGRRDADHAPDRRHDQARAAGAHRRAAVAGAAGARSRRPAAAAAAQPPVHPRHLGLDLRRGVDQHDAQAGPRPRDGPLRGDLPLAPHVRRLPVPGLGRGHGTATRRPRAATSWCSAAAWC